MKLNGPLLLALLFLGSLSPADVSSLRRPLHPPTGRTLARDNCPGLDVLHYDLDLTILPETHELCGIVCMNLQAKTDSLYQVTLDLRRLQVNGVFEGADSVDFTREDDKLILSPEIPLAPGEPRTFDIMYGGVPTNEGSNAFGGFFFSGGIAFSMGVGLYTDPPSMGRYWFPGHDHPSDKATAAVTLRVPTNWFGVSNGALLCDDMEDTARVVSWGTDFPIATYLMSVAAGPYVEISDDSGAVPIRHYVRPQEESHARASFARVPQMIDLFERLFGPYPFERFGNVSAPIGAMEHQTCVTYPWSLINGNLTYEWLTAHELSHMWWGDCITYADWTQIWISEGMATYSQALWAEEVDGPSGYRQEMYRQMQEYLGGVAAEGYFPLIDPEELWGVCTYEKGSCIMHMLRQELGDSLFFASLAQYRANHEYGNATTDSMQIAFEMTTGQDLSWFFDQWAREPGHPRLSFRYAMVPCENGDAILDVEVRQVQTIGPIFRFTLEVACDLADTTHWYSFVDSNEVATSSFRIPGQPTEVRFDPHHNVLFGFVDAQEMDRLYLRSMQLDDYGDDDGGLDPEEEAELVVGLQNPLTSLENLTLTLSSQTADVEVISGSASIPALPEGETATNTDEPFRIRSTGADPKKVELILTVAMENEGVLQLPIRLHLGAAKRLLVDDDLFENEYEEYYLAAMDTLPDGDSREVWPVQAMGPISSARLAKYASQNMVIWFTGDADSMALDANECQNIMAFLDAGGSLFLTGQNALDDLPSFPEGSDLLTNYLHVELVDPHYQGNRTVEGEDNDVIGNGLMGLIQGDGGADNQTSLTVINPLDGALPVMHYFHTDLDCGTRTDLCGKAVVLTFGFEAINQTQPHFLSRDQMIRRVADWLEGPGTGIDLGPEPRLLSLLVPDPFRRTSSITLHLREASPVRLALYDLAGRRIAMLHQGFLPSGASRISLSPRLAAGTYVLCIDVAGEEQSMPLVCLP